ncbi:MULTISPECIES: CHAD domain-containing protein [unclassified Cupriavidus]|uniref:CHAD domain-containing protein n=1 Tax=unclassified Cupriavidus TaxID=2640874 RepID=UPI001C002377|nr:MULTISPECIES: CHAD domain-containing protein [unclassified Cupriavidus]MCA3182371.1 CHAD domain-containing protein [Cupriavidus sp.]MCA3190028.1 CHAD domain-containing protein [Cupriavidus sp.]MCA3197479.1 CHAD domain-containing protein [Cupriavidus sp.]MCA3201818.1 CHAD domain-containing protein [Cupriavidus sp.]MCA3210413.1 CHAD domain-containing protein [Cupriavidus sp.]
MSRQPVLHRKMRPATAFVALGESGLRAVHDRLDALKHRDEVEDVHELRVAVRHLRAVAWAFGPVLPRQVKARWKQALHDVADAAGDVRDWDVFIAETLAPALEKQPEDALLVALIDIAQAKRTVAHAEMMTRLSRYRQAPLPTLSRDLLHLAQSDTRGRLETFAPKRIRKARDKVRERARIARDGKTEHVHKLRIGNKRLRYAIESLSDVLPGRYRKRLRKKLVARQSELGAVIDGAVARRLLCECLSVDPPTDSQA